jgi:hypothetical protein
MDRLWTGYWMGGTTMAVVVLLSHIQATPSWFTLPVSIAVWFLITPLGIWIAKRRQG